MEAADTGTHCWQCGPRTNCNWPTMKQFKPECELTTKKIVDSKTVSFKKPVWSPSGIHLILPETEKQPACSSVYRHYSTSKIHPEFTHIPPSPRLLWTGDLSPCTVAEIQLVCHDFCARDPFFRAATMILFPALQRYNQSCHFEMSIKFIALK